MDMTRHSSVVLAYVHPGTVSHSFMYSVSRALRTDGNLIGGILPVRYRPIGIGHTRNQMVEAFLDSGQD